MSELDQVEGRERQESVRRVVVEKTSDPVTGWLGWAIAFAVLMLGALAVYAVVTGVFTDTTPRTAEEAELARSAAALRCEPRRMEPHTRGEPKRCSRWGGSRRPMTVLDQGEKAVGEEVPALLFILRSRTMLLNQEERYAEAEKVGNRAIAASDKYLAAQFKELVAKGLSPQGADSKLTVAAAIQLAAAYIGQKKWDEAIKLYSYALTYDPAAADILSMRGWAYLEKGSETSATVDFNEALRYLPDDRANARGTQATRSQVIIRDREIVRRD